MKQIEASELILNKDGSIYHINLRPEDISDNIILVGDPQRVEKVSKFFDYIELRKQNREFITHTGYYNKKRLTVLSSGIGTDNIDIVVNELDALVNIDLEKRIIKNNRKSINLIRIGTSGGLQADINVDSCIVTRMAIGFDGLLNFYANRDKICDIKMERAFKEYTDWDGSLASPYFVESSQDLFNKFSDEFKGGITISAPGFYGPQGRVLRLALSHPELNEKIESFNYHGQRITNFEMESSAIYGLSKLLGHHALTICAIIANRVNKTYSKDYKKTVEKLIQITLEKITK
ncbi:MAG: nucleoside phosphorylase [Bacteroidia bacterium]|nr:nucleoside phosphorylase [Bacteroidia bacterium]